MEPSDHHIERFAHHVGATLLKAQGLEFNLAVLLAAAAGLGDDTAVEPDAQMNRRLRRTFGGLVREAETLGLPDDLMNGLRAALKARNWLIHHFFRLHGTAIFNLDMMARAVDQLEAAYRTFQAVQELMHPNVVRHIELSGWSLDALEEEVRALRAQGYTGPLWADDEEAVGDG